MAENKAVSDLTSGVSENPAKATVLVQGAVSLPSALNLATGDNASRWRKWHQIWKSYKIVSRLKSQPENLRRAKFMTCIGQDALDVYNTLQLDESKIKMDDVLTAKDKHFVRTVNTTYERYKFNRRQQQIGESFDTYQTSLRALLRTCNYGAMTANLLKARLVCSIQQDEIRKTLLQERDLNLPSCIDI